MNKIYLKDQYDIFFKRLISNDNFMLLRYGDGERAIMTGKSVKAQEGWSSPDCITPLGKELLKTLSLTEENVYYGISCPCCDINAYFWYLSNLKSDNITFSNMFVNINYQRFLKDFINIKRDAIVIGNAAGKNNKIGNLNVLRYYSVGDECQSFWNTQSDDLINRIINDFGDNCNILYAVAAGPLAEPILYKLYKNNPNNCYMDFGSSLDCYIHKNDTRPYSNPTSIFGKRNCWMYESKNISLSNRMILFCYMELSDLCKRFSRKIRKIVFKQDV